MNLFFETDRAYHCIDMETIKCFTATKNDYVLKFTPHTHEGEEFAFIMSSKKEFNRVMNIIAEQLNEALIQKNS